MKHSRFTVKAVFRESDFGDEVVDPGIINVIGKKGEQVIDKVFEISFNIIKRLLE